jgi:hypothetical protein
VNRIRFLASFGFVHLPFPCCGSLHRASNEFNALRLATNHSTQHGRNTPCPLLFSGAGPYEAIFSLPRNRPETIRAQPPSHQVEGFSMIDYILNLLYERSLYTYLSAMPKPEVQK